MKDAVGERWQSKDEADERAGSADVEERTSGTDGRANQNEGAESADEGGSGNEERITGVNVVMAAGEVMTEFMGEENNEEREGERDTVQKVSRMKVSKAERLEKCVEGGGLIVSIGSGEMRACDERS